MKFLLGTAALVTVGFAYAGQESPYAGEQFRDIKALSEQQISEYRSGAGVGMAKAAELNHFPGPKHVLQLAEQLNLDESQLGRTRALFEEMQQRASMLGHQLVAVEWQLDRAFSRQTIDTNSLRELLTQIGQLHTEIRFAHLEAHLRQRQILGPELSLEYDKLRGYNPGDADHSDHSRHN